jgi:hypothetical protein
VEHFHRRVLLVDETFRIFEFAPSRSFIANHFGRVHPQDMPSVEMAMAAATRAEAIDIECRLLMPNGEIKYLHVVGKAESGETGSIEVIGAVMDVTTRKLTEIELRRSKTHLADAQRLSRTGSVGMEVSTKRIFWSEEAARLRISTRDGTDARSIYSAISNDDTTFSKTFLSARRRAEVTLTLSTGC